MARFQSPPENAVQVPLTRRRVVLLFIVQVVLLGATFLLGFWVGRGQRHLEEQLSTSVTPPPVITEPGPPVIPVEEPKPSPSPSAGPTPLGTDDKAPSPSPPVPPSPGPPTESAPAPPSQPSPAPSSAKSPLPPAGGKFVLQVGAYRDSAKAHALVEKLKAQGLPAYMEPAARGLYRVRVGPYATRREAEDAISQVLKVVPGSKPQVQSMP
jgi:cell division septation protein DedD